MANIYHILCLFCCADGYYIVLWSRGIEWMCHSDPVERRFIVAEVDQAALYTVVRQRGRDDIVVWRREIIYAQMDRENVERWPPPSIFLCVVEYCPHPAVDC